MYQHRCIKEAKSGFPTCASIRRFIRVMVPTFAAHDPAFYRQTAVDYILRSRDVALAIVGTAAEAVFISQHWGDAKDCQYMNLMWKVSIKLTKRANRGRRRASL